MNTITPAAPAAPLVLVDETVTCTGPLGGHDVRIITDGTKAYAFGDDGDTELGCRTGTLIEFVCNQHDRHYPDADCDGYVTVDLASPGAWTVPTEETSALFAAEAVTMDVA